MLSNRNLRPLSMRPLGPGTRSVIDLVVAVHTCASAMWKCSSCQPRGDMWIVLNRGHALQTVRVLPDRLAPIYNLEFRPTPTDEFQAHDPAKPNQLGLEEHGKSCPGRQGARMPARPRPPGDRA